MKVNYLVLLVSASLLPILPVKAILTDQESANGWDDWKLSATETEIHFKRAFSRIKILPLDQTIHSFQIIFKDILTKKMQKIGVIQKNNS